MGENSWDHELSLFADDLFADLMSRHPSLRTLPRKYGGSRYFANEIGKCVMLVWHDIRQELDRKLRNDFPRFVKSEKCFKQYLKVFVDLVTKTEHNVINRILGVSAILFEIVCFVYRRRMTYYFGDASKYLFFMLLSVKTEEFYEEGVWALLASVSAKLTKGYNEEEICRQYLLENVCNFNPSNSTTTSKTNLTLKYSTETSSGIGENTFQDEKPEEDSAKERDSTLNEASTEIKIRITNPNFPSKEPSVMLIPESAVSESENSIVESAKSNEEYLVVPKQRLLSQTEVSQVVSESVKESEEPSRDSSQASLKLETSQTKLESLEESTERIMPDNGEPSAGELSKFSTEYIKNRAEDFVKPIDCLRESFQAETSPTDSESAKEVEKFLVEAILSNFQVRFLTKREEIEAMEYFSRDTQESTAKKSYPCTSPSDKVNNMTDERKTNLINSTEQKDSDVPSLKRDGVIQTALESVNNYQKSAEENVENAEILPTEISICTEHLCVNDSAKKNDSSLFKSPKLETCKKLTPVKAKTPSSEKRGVTDVKYKNSTPKCSNGKGTPIKTPTSGALKSSYLAASTGRNKTETQTAKILKPDSVKSKSRSPAHVKTPTDRGLPNFELKSSEKSDRSRRLSLPKSSPGIKKNSPRSISVSAAKAESCAKDFSATDSLKPLPTAVVNSKLGAKDLSSNQLKSSSSTTSESIPKCKVTAKDAPIACEKAKRYLQSSNPRTEKVKEGTSFENVVGSSSAKSTGTSECIPGKTSKESLDTRLDTEETSHHTQKCEETKSKKTPIASARNANCSSGRSTRNAPGKNSSVDSKNEKPRWR